MATVQKQQKKDILSRKEHFWLDFVQFWRKKQLFLHISREAVSEKLQAIHIKKF